MPEPLTLAAVGAVVLSEGVKFLYGQAGEVLKRWREREKAGQGQVTNTTPDQVSVQPPPILAGVLKPLVFRYERMASLEPTMRELWAALAPYAQGLDEVDPADADLVRSADALRRQLEIVFGQRITFQGERREPSGTPIVVGVADIKEIAGYAAAVRAQHVVGGGIRGELKSDKVLPSAEAVAVDLGTVGGSPGPGTPESGGAASSRRRPEPA